MGISKERGRYFQAKWDEIEYRFANKEMEQEIKKLKSGINKAICWIDMTIDTIKEQPTGNDEWILDRLNGIKQCLKDSGNNE